MKHYFNFDQNEANYFKACCSFYSKHILHDYQTMSEFHGTVIAGGIIYIALK